MIIVINHRHAFYKLYCFNKFGFTVHHIEWDKQRTFKKYLKRTEKGDSLFCLAQ